VRVSSSQGFQSLFCAFHARDCFAISLLRWDACGGVFFSALDLPWNHGSETKERNSGAKRKTLEEYLWTTKGE